MTNYKKICTNKNFPLYGTYLATIASDSSLGQKQKADSLKLVVWEHDDLYFSKYNSYKSVFHIIILALDLNATVAKIKKEKATLE